MAYDSFICATLTGRRGSHTPFVQYKQKWKRPTSVHRRLSRTPAVLGGVGAVVGDKNAESCEFVRPLRILLVIHPVRRTYFVVVR